MCIRDSINAEYGDSNRRLMAEQSLRAMTDEDLDTVLRVQELCYPPALRESRSTFQAMREAYPRGARVLQSGGCVVGYALWFPCARSSAPHALEAVPEGPDGNGHDCMYVHDVSVTPQARGRQLADTMLHEAATAAAQHQYQWLALTAVGGTERFWGSKGFFALPGRQHTLAASGYPEGSVSMEALLWTVQRVSQGGAGKQDWAAANRLNLSAPTANPVRALLGGRVVAVDTQAGALWLQCEAVEGFCHSQPRVVQGGVVAACGDMAMAQLMVLTAMVQKQRTAVATLDLSVSYLQAARPGPLDAVACSLKTGRSIVFAEAEVRDGGVCWPPHTRGGGSPGLLAKMKATMKLARLNKQIAKGQSKL
eukprot:TRINITY_DN4134_c0_g1_i5.p1 TRINITY_DN4134_c0_g1~~TRINITY_DN4134_c0_g1_i5.p1  ORF type:complete len:366 (-),score=107.87 TRINITY_DN4134_c0_g1_i5:179-1276(-)